MKIYYCNIRRILEYLRINECCKKCALEFASGVIKMYDRCQDKRVCLKKEIKEEMTEHVCSRKYVCSTKATFHWNFMEPEQTRSKWSVIEPLVITVPENMWRQPKWTFQGKENNRYTLSYQPQGFGQWRGLGRP